jgi:hypothetical protein
MWSSSSSSSLLHRSTTTTPRPPSWADRHRQPVGRRRATFAAVLPRAQPPLRGDTDAAASSTSSSSSSRRAALLLLSTSAAALPLLPPNPAQASKLPAAADRAWQAVTGAPPDLAFPEFFLGTWRAQSSLVGLDLPLGDELLGASDSPLREAVERARREELGKGAREFRVRFVRNARGFVVFDRAFNLAALAASYGGGGGGGGAGGGGGGNANAATTTPAAASGAAAGADTSAAQIQSLMRRIEWNLDDPNVLVVRPGGGGGGGGGGGTSGGGGIRTRVTRRSETPAPPSEAGNGAGDDDVAPRAFETSEFMEQVFEGAGALGAGGTLAPPRVKASQVFVKWRWRTEREAAGKAAAGGQPTLVVATQVVSDYLTPYDGDRDFLRAGNRPVATYTYRLAMVRDDDRPAA